MVFYVAYRASKESKDRSLLPHRLRALGCRQLNRSFWEINEEEVNRVLKVLEKNQPILLKRVREVKKPYFLKNGDVSDLGSLVIVIYSTPKEVNREKIKNFLRKAPCIRLGRSVYAFSQKHSLFDKDSQLVDAFAFAKFIKEIQGNVRVISRVMIVNAGSTERVLQEIRERVEREIFGIIGSSKELYGEVIRGNDIRLTKNSFSRNKRRFITLKKVATFYEKWTRMDFSRSLMKSYRAVKKVNSIIKRIDDEMAIKASYV